MKNNKASAVRKNAVRASRKQAQTQVQWRELGEVAVDSGQIVVCDPAYLTGIDTQKFYDQLADGGEDVENELAGGGILNGAQISNTWGKRFLGLTLPNFGGDGVFPVYGTFNGDGTLAAVFIDLNENRLEGFQSERISKDEFDALLRAESEEKSMPQHVEDPAQPSAEAAKAS